MKDNPPPSEPTGAVTTPVRRTSLRRVAAASSIGTTIEFYDFFIYGTAAALVFPTVFFPAADPSTATLASFATFAVAFFARPVGAILFGHFGDRIGRKRTLVWTLLIMGFATVAIGLLPGYDSGAFGLFPGGIGIWAPVLLVAMRFLQGFAVGGEWAGATLLTAEYAPPGKRGLYAMFPQLGPAFAFFLSSGTFLIASRTLGTTSDAFLDYGWRIPFILSFALVGVGLWVRLAVAETPVFRDRVREPAPAARSLPFLDAVRYQPKEILIAAGALTSLFSLFYTGTAFLTSYGVGTLKLSRDYILTMGMLAAIVFGLATAASALWSDRVGRRRVIMVSCAVAVPWTLALFPILDIGGPAAFAIGLFGTLAVFGIAYGPAGALLPEMFQARYRYTGAGMGYNLAGILGGALPPLIATKLLAGPGSFWVGVLLAALSVVSVLCTRLIVETKDRSIDA
ncbi:MULTISPECIES: MFS transporter [unclassified Nocardia]|uniref:MFS transporter n=1 Tax=unclassified Nocardia TaxID=2637762 RepID=UPI0024A80010|nr:MULTISPECIES: MFS transporter [unclassified Nocardia]